MSCANRAFMDHQTQILDAPLESLAFYGMPSSLYDSEEACHNYHEKFPRVAFAGLLRSSPVNQLPMSTMQVPEAKRLIYDSAKLARLDALLQELKQGDHRVLIYFQMTRMMDLMEEYLIYRQYKYLRLDGSSKIEDRRDMVIDWQTRQDIFVFLLSTRAGGLGINLTAADTVVFYDHDWNPSNDAQAMDRAHRLGQTRQVTVYRLITRGTIDERIVQLARVKKDVQDIVVGNKNFTDVTKPSEIVQLLLNDEQLASLNSSASQVHDGQPATTNGAEKKPAQDFWNDEEDNFFGHTTLLAPDGDDQGTPVHSSARGKKRKTGATSASRGRRSGIGGRKKMTPMVASAADAF
ncbi:putative DNA helicase ino80 [Termitomyces sp. T159_Od127]|nr:putative DNA helicase ino80 [Termitomyces sp. T159_Od127]